ncbi:MAG TPA: hypothetical protein VHS99_03860 [Chloroflexota bacterium]|nr:hypothetical protein [Chloroflexota bacterium]
MVHQGPHTAFRDDLEDMLRVIRHAAGVARGLGEAPSVFALWQALHAEQARWGAAQGCPPLLSSLGTSLIERAAIDAFCRASGTSFGAALRGPGLGLRLGQVHPELQGLQVADLLPAHPLRSTIVRHTVGLGDPLSEADIPPQERLEDGLPQSLEAVIRTYGLTHFKLKLSGDTARDVERLTGIATVIASTAGEEYAFTLDGNEQYHGIDTFQEFWASIRANRSLAPFMAHLLFVEQPLHRDQALQPAAAAALRRWEDGPPIIIDEADSTIDSLPLALECGYSGTSYKNCKGVFRGVANACLVARRRGAAGSGRAARYLVSGEDLANVGPVALLQDLAATATLGIEHVERNGHHYFAGLSMLPQDVQQEVLARHGDLYRRHERGFPTLDVRRGRIATGSVVDAPFGYAIALDVTRFTPLDEWRFDSLPL